MRDTSILSGAAVSRFVIRYLLSSNSSIMMRCVGYHIIVLVISPIWTTRHFDPFMSDTSTPSLCTFITLVSMFPPYFLLIYLLHNAKGQARCKASPVPSCWPSALNPSWKVTVPCGVCPSKGRAKKTSGGTPSCTSPGRFLNPNFL